MLIAAFNLAPGVIFLHGYKAQPVSAGGRRHAFELIPTDQELKHFFFHAQTETEKKRCVIWLQIKGKVSRDGYFYQ
jgi:hypothetical protein